MNTKLFWLFFWLSISATNQHYTSCILLRALAERAGMCLESRQWGFVFKTMLIYLKSEFPCALPVSTRKDYIWINVEDRSTGCKGHCWSLLKISSCWRRKFFLRTSEVKAGNNSKKTKEGVVGMAEEKKEYQWSRKTWEWCKDCPSQEPLCHSQVGCACQNVRSHRKMYINLSEFQSMIRQRGKYLISVYLSVSAE